jgi:hypothetical protein
MDSKEKSNFINKLRLAIANGENGIEYFMEKWKNINETDRLSLTDPLLLMCHREMQQDTYISSIYFEFQNIVQYIIDTLVKEFKMAYYGDDGFQNLWRPAEESHNPDVDSNIRKDMMTTHGYTAIDKDTIIIPDRIEDDYKKPIEQNKPIPPIGSTDQTYLSNLENDNDLPF